MIQTLNHFSIRTRNIPETQHFYETVLGLSVGPRPNFPFPGLWLYVGDTSKTSNAVVHVIGIEDKNDGLNLYLGERSSDSTLGSGALDHVAFFATGLEDYIKRLSNHQITPKQRMVPSLGLHQLFIDDPNGIVVEINFPAEEKTDQHT